MIVVSRAVKSSQSLLLVYAADISEGIRGLDEKIEALPERIAEAMKK